MTTPMIFGHRGAPEALPENSLAGFAYALEHGADGIELDVFVTRDGVPVVTHNPCLMADTTRDSSGNWLETEGPAIISLTYEELQQFDIGGIRPESEYAKKHPNQQVLPNTKVPRLVEVLELIRDAGRPIETMVELKHSPLVAEGQLTPDAFVQEAAKTIASLKMEDSCLIHAFNWQILTAAAKHAPALRRSHLSMVKHGEAWGSAYQNSPWLDGASHQTAQMLRDLAARGAEVWSPYHKDLTPEDLSLAQDLGLRVMTWTVTQTNDLQDALAQNLDGFITDDPKRAVEMRDAKISVDE